jgi:sugar lactone lactonase YvrE
MSPASSRILGLLLAPVLLAGCGPIDQGSSLVLLDKGYRPSLLIGDGQGLVVADGLRVRGGELLIADEGGSAFRAWSGPGRLRTISDRRTGIDSPEDFVLDDQGNIFFTDDDAGGVWRIDSLGRTSLLAGKDKGLVSTEAIAMLPSGALLVGDGKRHRIFRVERDGRVSDFLGPERGIRKPESMVFDTAGDLYIADNEENVLYKLTPDGRLHRVIAERAGFSPETLWADGQGLLITDSTNGRLWRYDPVDGLRPMLLFAGEMRTVTGVTADAAGNIYLAVTLDSSWRRGIVLRLERK